MLNFSRKAKLSPSMKRDGNKNYNYNYTIIIIINLIKHRDANQRLSLIALTLVP